MPFHTPWYRAHGETLLSAMFRKIYRHYNIASPILAEIMTTKKDPSDMVVKINTSGLAPHPDIDDATFPLLQNIGKFQVNSVGRSDIVGYGLLKGFDGLMVLLKGREVGREKELEAIRREMAKEWGKEEDGVDAEGSDRLTLEMPTAKALSAALVDSSVAEAEAIQATKQYPITGTMKYASVPTSITYQTKAIPKATENNTDPPMGLHNTFPASKAKERVMANSLFKDLRHREDPQAEQRGHGERKRIEEEQRADLEDWVLVEEGSDEDFQAVDRPVEPRRKRLWGTHPGLLERYWRV